jgi:hypothetical protein
LLAVEQIPATLAHMVDAIRAPSVQAAPVALAAYEHGRKLARSGQHASGATRCSCSTCAVNR